MSGKKTQSMVIDSIMAYMLFSFFLIYMSSASAELFNPFSMHISDEMSYKASQALSYGFLKEGFSRDDLERFCTSKDYQISAANSGYLIKSAQMPFYDESINESIKGIHFQRKGSEMLLFINSEIEQELSIKIFSKKNILIESIAKGEGFNYSKASNNGMQTFEIFSNSTEYPEIHYFKSLDDSTIFFELSDSSYAFMGKTPFSFRCGEMKLFEKSIVSRGFSELEGKKLICDYYLEAWIE